MVIKRKYSFGQVVPWHRYRINSSNTQQIWAYLRIYIPVFNKAGTREFHLKLSRDTQTPQRGTQAANEWV